MSDRRAWLEALPRIDDHKERLAAAMRDGLPRTKRWLSMATGIPEHSLSARMSDLRKMGATFAPKELVAPGVYVYRMTKEPGV